MTLDEILIETATYIDEDLIKSNDVYVGEGLKLVNKLKSAINYAYKKICREKYKLDYFETLSKDSPLTKKFYQLIKLVITGTDLPIDYEVKGDNIYYNYDGQVDITYYYIPDELVNLQDVPKLPESAVDHKILCFYAAFHYLSMEQDERAAVWLNLWNDGFENINQARAPIVIENVFGW